MPETLEIRGIMTMKTYELQIIILVVVVGLEVIAIDELGIPKMFVAIP